MIRTPLCDMLEIEYPIIQGGMGPLNTKQLGANVSNAGGLGTLSIFNMSTPPEEAYRIFRSNIDYIMEHSGKNFACNVPIGAQIGERFLKTTDAYLGAIFDARKDREVARRLKLLITSALLVVLIQAACTLRSESDAEWVIRFSHVYQINSDYQLMAERFRDLLLERTDGRVRVQIYPSGQLGSERVVFEQLLDCFDIFQLPDRLHGDLAAGCWSVEVLSFQHFESPYLLTFSLMISA